MDDKLSNLKAPEIANKATASHKSSIEITTQFKKGASVAGSKSLNLIGKWVQNQAKATNSARAGLGVVHKGPVGTPFFGKQTAAVVI
jgi:hypothetical protein